MRVILLCLLTLGLTVNCVASAKDGEQRVPLPPIDSRGEMSVEAAIELRRSVREFAPRGLTLDDISQLLWAAQGITDKSGLRAAPSAGALYPLELYVVAGDVEALPAGVYRYRSTTHDLVSVARGEYRKSLASAALGQTCVRSAPAVLVMTSVYARSTAKYGQRGLRYAHIEVGHAAQNVYLQATARKLGTVFVGAFDDAAVSDALELPEDHEPLGLMPVGHKR